MSPVLEPCFVVEDLGFSVQGFVFRVEKWFRVRVERVLRECVEGGWRVLRKVPGFRVSGSGFNVSGFRCRVQG